MVRIEVSMKSTLGVAATLSLAGAALVLAQSSAEAAGGTRDCSGVGQVAVTAEYQWASGFRAFVKPPGPPTTPTWGRRNDPGANLYPRQLTFVSPHASGTWGASVVNDDYGGLLGARSQCSRRPGPTTALLEAHNLADRDCPAGQTVVFDTGGFADHWYFWRDTPSSLQRRILNGQEFAIDVPRFVDTGMNSIVDVRVEAHRNTNWPGAEDYITGYGTYCSDTLDIHAE